MYREQHSEANQQSRYREEIAAFTWLKNLFGKRIILLAVHSLSWLTDKTLFSLLIFFGQNSGNGQTLFYLPSTACLC